MKSISGVDKIPSWIRLPLGILLLILGAIFWFVPFINGIIFIIIGARMMGKKFSTRASIFLERLYRKNYASYSESIFHVIKK